MLKDAGRVRKIKTKKCQKCSRTFEINQDEIITIGKKKTIVCPNCGNEQSL